MKNRGTAGAAVVLALALGFVSATGYARQYDAAEVSSSSASTPATLCNIGRPTDTAGAQPDRIVLAGEIPWQQRGH